MVTRNHRIRFATNNLAADSASTVTAASALSAFPLTNLLLDQRFRLYKPAGNFTIDATNNKIYIADGSNKTITLSSANYTYTTLASHIQTQLNASSSLWTCTYSTTTNKFTIGRASGTATLRFTQTTAATWDTLGYTAVVDTAAGTGRAGDETRNHTSEYIDIDLGVAQPVTFFALLGPLGETFTVSSVGVLTLMGNTTSTMTAPAVTVTVTTDDNGAFAFLDDLADTTYRYWRVKLVDRLNTAGPEAFEFGHMYLGDYTTIERRNVSSGLEKTLIDTSQELTSENGASFFYTGYKYNAFDSVSIEYMDASDRRALEQAFYELGRSTPFYISFDPTLEVSDDLSELTRYVTFSTDPTFSHVKADIYTVRMSFKEVM